MSLGGSSPTGPGDLATRAMRLSSSLTFLGPTRSPHVQKPLRPGPAALYQSDSSDDDDIIIIKVGKKQLPVIRRSTAPSPRISKKRQKREDSEDSTSNAREKQDDDVWESSSTSSAEPPPQKKAKKSKKTAVKRMKPLRDPLRKGLDIVMCGVHAGAQSGAVGQYYATKNNLFWRCLARSRLTDRVLHYAEAAILPTRYNLGITVLVPNPTENVKKIKMSEKLACVPALLHKISQTRPRIFTFVSIEMRDCFMSYLKSCPTLRARNGRQRQPQADPEIKVGLQPIAISLPREANSEETQRHKVLFWTTPYTSHRPKQYPFEVQVKLFRRMRRDLAKLKAGTLELPDNLVEYRIEDLLPPASDDSSSEEDEPKRHLGDELEEEDEEDQLDSDDEPGGERPEPGRGGGHLDDGSSDDDLNDGSSDDDLEIVEQQNPGGIAGTEGAAQGALGSEGEDADVPADWRFPGQSNWIRTEPKCCYEETETGNGPRCVHKRRSRRMTI